MTADVVAHPTMAREARDVRVLALAMNLLAERAYRWVSLVLVAAAFAFVLLYPSVLRIVTAVLFTVLTHAPLWWTDLRRKGATPT